MLKFNIAAGTASHLSKVKIQFFGGNVMQTMEN